MTINLNESNSFEFSFNTPNTATTGMYLKLTSEYSNEVLFDQLASDVVTNDRFTTLSISLDVALSSDHKNGIYKYEVYDSANLYDQGLVKLIITPGGDFGKREYISNNENREAKVIFRPSYE